MKRKGQAAMEFLMTYGWAILAAIIVIGVLAIYFNPSNLVSDTAVITPPLYATGVVMSATQVQLEVKNNGVDTLTTQAAGTSITDCTGTPTGVGALAAGTTQIITFPGCSLSGTVNANIAINYTSAGTSLPQTSTGTLSGTI